MMKTISRYFFNEWMNEWKLARQQQIVDQKKIIDFVVWIKKNMIPDKIVGSDHSDHDDYSISKKKNYPGNNLFIFDNGFIHWLTLVYCK